MCIPHKEHEINISTMRDSKSGLLIAEFTGAYVHAAFHSVQSASQFATATGWPASL